MRRILVADDSSTVRNVVAHAFRGTDVEVLEAASGEEALEVARRERPDLVLCDVLMMGISGYEVAEALGEERIPVLLLTGPFEPFDEERARRAGSVGFLAKPFEPRALVERVREILGSRAGEDATPAGRPAAPAAGVPRPGAGEVLPPVAPPPPAPGLDDGPLEVREPSRRERPPGSPGRVPLPGDVDFDLGTGPPPAPAAGPPPAPAVPPEVVREEVRRVVAELAPGIVREVAWEVVPDLLERLLREAAPAPPTPRSPGDEDR